MVASQRVTPDWGCGCGRARIRRSGNFRPRSRHNRTCRSPQSHVTHGAGPYWGRAAAHRSANRVCTQEASTPGAETNSPNPGWRPQTQQYRVSTMLARLEEPEVIEEPEEPVRSIVLGDGTFGATHTFSAVTVTSLGRPAIVTDNQARCADQTRRSESMGAASFAGRSGRQAHSGGLRQAPDDLIAPRRRAARFDRQLSFVKCTKTSTSHTHTHTYSAGCL